MTCDCQQAPLPHGPDVLSAHSTFTKRLVTISTLHGVQHGIIHWQSDIAFHVYLGGRVSALIVSHMRESHMHKIGSAALLECGKLFLDLVQSQAARAEARHN